ncbi:hypothetical protein SAMN02745945_00154 [Peptoclostridium litorale DSM 5388]|uniref:Putative phosphohydrolase n=1 Tax=Peptoclostridium litorale DSM 5388 TaxID=1121324 RepID=A0A069RIL7_PEPLI|nr:hypothetical protein [Peptoclostridium litorale]KDR96598.1 putative phosphohydrolase [Peptoclostridium litorale DSM 5388]SIN68647.1 hypothetical protein SAMN02745945_00154 [Peptoclostridium litorale DSM 5388]
MNDKLISMKTNKAVIMLIIAIGAVIGLIVHSLHNYIVDRNFEPVDSAFNHTQSASSYSWDGKSISVKGGFVKGMLKGEDIETVIVRSLAPEMGIELISQKKQDIRILVENVDSGRIEAQGNFKIVNRGTGNISIEFSLGENNVEGATLKPRYNNENYFEFVILGDNRLFYQTISNFKVPLYTTLGNHDIREGGRDIYGTLFGPEYYSFDYTAQVFRRMDFKICNCLYGYLQGHEIVICNIQHKKFSKAYLYLASLC